MEVDLCIVIIISLLRLRFLRILRRLRIIRIRLRIIYLRILLDVACWHDYYSH